MFEDILYDTGWKEKKLKVLFPSFWLVEILHKQFEADKILSSQIDFLYTLV